MKIFHALPLFALVLTVVAQETSTTAAITTPNLRTNKDNDVAPTPIGEVNRKDPVEALGGGAADVPLAVPLLQKEEQGAGPAAGAPEEAGKDYYYGGGNRGGGWGWGRGGGGWNRGGWNRGGWH